MLRIVSLMKLKFCIVYRLGYNVCRLVCGPRYQCFSGVYCHRLNSVDGRNMFLRNFNPQDYNVNVSTAENPSVNTPLAQGRIKLFGAPRQRKHFRPLFQAVFLSGG